MSYKKSIVVFILFYFITSCDKTDKPEDPYGINYDVQESMNAVVVDTQIGWTLLCEEYGFIELMEPLHDSLHLDGLKVRIEINRGKTYENAGYLRDFTYAIVNSVVLNPTLYTEPPAVIEILWSPDESDEIVFYPDGYGYAVTISDGDFKIRQPHFPGVSGLGSFRTEIEAFKMGALVAHLLLAKNGLPTTGVPALDFLKIDWYE